MEQHQPRLFGASMQLPRELVAKDGRRLVVDPGGLAEAQAIYPCRG
ncbi:hypothetical protein ACFXPM_30435 [Streptomyces sp. NPDC059095]